MAKGGGSTPQDETKGQGDYTVASGDCIGSIAFERGFAPKTIWEHADNAELKRARTSMHMLLPGDLVSIPALTVKQESGATEKRHVFKRPDVPAKLNLRLIDWKSPEEAEAARTASGPDVGADTDTVSVDPGDPAETNTNEEPLANKPYRLEIEGKVVEGQTDSQGKLSADISPGAKSAKLILEPGTEQQRIMDIQLGALAPFDTDSGVHQRLTNLGFLGSTSANSNDKKEAMKKYQNLNDKTPDGKVNDDMKSSIKDVHGS